jgi:hypothetical protein
MINAGQTKIAPSAAFPKRHENTGADSYIFPHLDKFIGGGCFVNPSPAWREPQRRVLKLEERIAQQVAFVSC